MEEKGRKVLKFQCTSRPQMRLGKRGKIPVKFRPFGSKSNLLSAGKKRNKTSCNGNKNASDAVCYLTVPVPSVHVSSVRDFNLIPILTLS